MEYRRLGRTGLKVSRLGLGAGNFGGIGSDPRFYGKGEGEREAFALMDRAWDLGINFFDTADAYGGGRSEAAIGRWLATKDAAVRHGLLVSTKVFNPVGPGPNDRGLSRRHIKRQVEASLKRLEVDRIDMYLAHEPDPDTPIEETLGALDDLVHQGKVHYIGASNFEAWRLSGALEASEKHGLVRFEWAQNGYSLLDRGVELELLPLCRDRGLGVTPFSPLAGGWLTGKYRSADQYPSGSRMTLRPEPYAHLVRDAVFGRLEAFRAIAGRRRVDMASLAVAWVLAAPETTAVVIGPRTVEQLDLMHAALGVTLDERARAELSALFA
jgi:aryl-alcohol dehydrogenase-like predicted oxidoreductase